MSTTCLRHSRHVLCRDVFSETGDISDEDIINIVIQHIANKNDNMILYSLGPIVSMLVGMKSRIALIIIFVVGLHLRHANRDHKEFLSRLNMENLLESKFSHFANSRALLKHNPD